MAGEVDSLHVSNLEYNTSNSSLQAAFPGCVSAHVVMDRNTNRSKGFGFVKFGGSVEATSALDRLGGPGATILIDGRECKLNYSHTRDNKPSQGGYGGGGGNQGYGGGGGNYQQTGQQSYGASYGGGQQNRGGFGY